MFQVKNINKFYRLQDSKIEVLKKVSFSLKKGEIAAIMGPSGSGKSTLLGICAGLDRPDSGNIIFDGDDLTSLSEDSLCKIRSEKIGFIFQNFQLIKTLTALDNVSLPLIISSTLNKEEIQKKAMTLLDQVGLRNRANHFPSQLSGGEEQRVAIARSFINDPVLLFADEPTGNLDSKNGENILKLLLDLNKKFHSTLLLVTHDSKVAKFADKIFLMKDGIMKTKKDKSKIKK
ncbi:MAG: ABC transporter ATP-binding protein [Leptospiraceae bacterium]|nr:ABC transporter ATP-binding protein [Leptospiraceae bacterium]MCK6381096.1 ABC transporter ATP-binding protein [Leptospiraceae bacterium]NUM40539.1 ABC transporter ATP-binding protein [Leptospiraceae bacterium]